MPVYPGALPGTVFSFLAPYFPSDQQLLRLYAGYGLIPVAVTLGLAIWAFRNALGGRALFREGWLDS